MNHQPDDGSCPESAVSWRLDVDDFPLFRRLGYVCPCLLGGMVVLVVALLGWLVIVALVAGNVARALSLVVVAVLGLLSRRYLPALLVADVREPIRGRYSRPWLAIGSVLGAVVLLGVARLHPGAPVALFVVSWVPVVLAARFPTDGCVDRDAETLLVDGTAVPLALLRDYRTLSVGSVVVYWLSYVRGAPTAPRVVVVPRDVATTVAELLARSPPEPAPGVEAIGWQERWVAAVFGFGLLAVGPILWVALPPGDGRLIALFAGAMFGLFGGLFLWYAATT